MKLYFTLKDKNALLDFVIGCIPTNKEYWRQKIDNELDRLSVGGTWEWYNAGAVITKNADGTYTWDSLGNSQLTNLVKGLK